MGLALLALVLVLVVPGVAKTTGGDLPRPGPWKKGREPEGWVVVETDLVQVQCQVGETLAEALADHVEAVIAQCRVWLPTRRALPRLVVKVFEGAAALSAYHPEGEVALALHDGDSDEVLVWDTGRAFGQARDLRTARLTPRAASRYDAELRDALTGFLRDVSLQLTPDLAGLVAHETWHWYTGHALVSRVALPPWLEEGLGDELAARTRTDGRVGLDVDNRHVRWGLDLAFVFTRTGLGDPFADGPLVPFEEFLSWDRKRFYAEGDLAYAQAWAMVRALLGTDDGRQLVLDLLTDVRESKDAARATERVFADHDLDQLQREFLGMSFFRGRPLPVPGHLLDVLGADPLPGPGDLAGPAEIVEAAGRLLADIHAMADR